MTSVAFDILINNDAVADEGGESFTIILNSSSLPTGIMVGNPSLASVVIFDDECKL